jgi:hypothetical protein
VREFSRNARVIPDELTGTCATLEAYP